MSQPIYFPIHLTTFAFFHVGVVVIVMVIYFPSLISFCHLVIVGLLIARDTYVHIGLVPQQHNGKVLQCR